MEALAKHAFNATADDELSFSKEDVLKVISKEDDQNWYKAECNGREGFVPNNYIAMKPHQWYKGKVTRTQAEELLLRKNGSRWEQPDGAFLVRGCESQPGEFSISVKFRDGVQHFKILRDGCGKYFLWVVKFDSINALVEHHRSASVSRVENIFLKDMVPTGHCRQAVALYDFKVEDASEIDMCKGDCITGIEAVDENWWKGVNMRTNKAGLFPKSYVAERHDN